MRSKPRTKSKGNNEKKTHYVLFSCNAWKEYSSMRLLGVTDDPKIYDGKKSGIFYKKTTAGQVQKNTSCVNGWSRLTPTMKAAVSFGESY